MRRNLFFGFGDVMEQSEQVVVGLQEQVVALQTRIRELESHVRSLESVNRELSGKYNKPNPIKKFRVKKEN
jgi:hypothetical protein